MHIWKGECGIKSGVWWEGGWQDTWHAQLGTPGIASQSGGREEAKQEKLEKVNDPIMVDKSIVCIPKNIQHTLFYLFYALIYGKYILTEITAINDV